MWKDLEQDIGTNRVEWWYIASACTCSWGMSEKIGEEMWRSGEATSKIQTAKKGKSKAKCQNKSVWRNVKQYMSLLYTHDSKRWQLQYCNREAWIKMKNLFSPGSSTLYVYLYVFFSFSLVLMFHHCSMFAAIFALPSLSRSSFWPQHEEELDAWRLASNSPTGILEVGETH